MARKPLTDRQLQLKEAHDRVDAERRQLRAIRGMAAAQLRAVKAAEAALATLSRCDQCGEPAYLLGGELQLCGACTRARKREEQIAHFASLGFGPDGRSLRKSQAA
jgi:ribosomal protein S14